MEHREARRLLVDFERRSLDSDARSRVASHVERCDACEEWLHSYRLLAAALQNRDQMADVHPASDRLALWAVQPEEVAEEEQVRVEEHLASCPECRREVDIVQEALFEAKRLSDRGPAVREAGRVRRLAAAAALAVLAIGGVLFWRSFPVRSSLNGISPVERTTSVGADEVNQELAVVELSGEHLFESQRQLTMTDLKITRGSTVTFRAGQRIVLGHGFQIGAGATVAMEVTNPEAMPAGTSHLQPRTKDEHKKGD